MELCRGEFMVYGRNSHLSAGCTKPGGNIINLPKDLYFHQETFKITHSNCESGYSLEEEHKTITCDRAIVYKIRVVTADERVAGTDGNVTIRLKGTAGNTGIIGLPGRFEQNSIVDIAKLLPDVGTIITITIGVTRLNMFDGWKPSHVTVHDTRRKHFYLFQHDGTELDNRSITLGLNGCVTTYTIQRGFLRDRGQYYTLKYVGDRLIAGGPPHDD
ncbi:hypothetical protein DPMN_153656 [Dreissena polymorpha]|uniref:PLAT domain-containing protein n=1 Tax=Dreissena polymorpha TaxID=45954 RepID=A0A9D4J509_DREPO|nr:hypothetical protein DPMN_153656 [Dreissena polymorpha]